MFLTVTNSSNRVPCSVLLPTLSQPIYRLGDVERKSRLARGEEEPGRQDEEGGEREGGEGGGEESFISGSHAVEAEDSGLMFKAVAFLSLLFLYILVSRVLFKQGGAGVAGGGGVIKVQ